MHPLFAIENLSRPSSCPTSPSPARKWSAYGEAGLKVGGFMGSYSHSPPGGFSAVDVAVCTIEKANSHVNRLVEEGRTREVACVVDEMHNNNNNNNKNNRSSLTNLLPQLLPHLHCNNNHHISNPPPPRLRNPPPTPIRSPSLSTSSNRRISWKSAL